MDFARMWCWTFVTVLCCLLWGCPDPESDDDSTQSPPPSVGPETPTTEPDVPTPTLSPGPTASPEPTTSPGPTTPPEQTLTPPPTSPPGPTPTLEPDQDGDGYSPSGGDCDDTDAAISPEAVEIPYDTIDQDCDGSDTTDADGDGFPGGIDGTDCDDHNAGIRPGALETAYDGIDQDCNGSDLTDVDGDGASGGLEGSDCDDQDPDRYPGHEEVPYDEVDQDCDGRDLTDVDEDGQDAVEADGTDCDDTDPTVYKGAQEEPYDGIDQDCNGADLRDVDGDTYEAEEVEGDDCDDYNLNTYPGAKEFADGKDNDCDGLVDEDLSTTDDDQDGFSDAQGDCNDYQDTIYPGATEVPYDGIDQDCDGLDLTDVDGDGAPGGPKGSDCNDHDDTIYPAATEVPYDGIDQDCDGTDLEDVDRDGYASTAVDGGDDCDDKEALTYPGAAEVPYDGIDQDCDGKDLTDVDGDGFPALGGPDVGPLDCNDRDPAIRPDADEICDGVDNNCDEVVDTDAIDREPFYVDSDGDGYGDPDNVVLACSLPAGCVENAGDCDDILNAVNPDALEACNGLDDDCDGETDEGVLLTFYPDTDGDGFGDPAQTVFACEAPEGYVTGESSSFDCDDTNPEISPAGTEVCDPDNRDEDCDGLAENEDSSTDPDTKAWYFPDADGDGFGDQWSEGALSCDPPLDLGVDYLADQSDCDDADASINPDALEVCDPDDVDEDCNGLADNADPDAADDGRTTFYPDADQDGYGDANNDGIHVCDDPSSPSMLYQLDFTDCEDGNANVNPSQPEVANGIDDNCNGTVDEGVYFSSCKAILTATPGVPDGVYNIDPDGLEGGTAPFSVYCDMTSDGGGWTLVIKINGGLGTFGYYSTYWTTTQTYNEGDPNFNQNEAKLASYHTMPLTEMRLGFNDGGKRWIKVPASGSSLYAMIRTGTYVFLDASRDTWSQLVSSPALQPNCNTRGFNAPGNENHSRVRIGITANNEGDCNSCDSFIGFGGLGMGCGTTDAGNTAGNWMTCEASVNKRLFGYVFIR